MAQYEDYLERIDKKIVQENYNLGLGFKEGYVFFRVTHRELFPLLYDLIAEMPDVFGAGVTEMAAKQYVSPKELKSDTLAATNIWSVEEEDHIYQLFCGMSPSVFRMFPAYPRETEINQLDIGLHLPTYTIFGFIDGFESPLDKPSPRSQVFIPYGPLIGWAMYNYAPYAIQPMMRFIVNRLKVEAITDPELVMKIVQRRVECSLTTIGGIDATWGTSKKNYKDWWGVLPVSLLDTPTEIARKLRGVG